MRIVAVVACVTFFVTSGSAFAADCGKGMLWPHVRQPGDCLTEAEIRAGQTGVYNGPVNTNPDVSAMTSQESGPSEVTATGSSGPATGATSPSIGTNNRGVLFGEGPPISNTGRSRVACTKGWMWPFVREPGDCLTQAERRTNPTGVYGGGAIAQVSATNNANVAGAAAATGDGPQGAAETPVTIDEAISTAPASASQAATCSKGWLWPFVRKEGDCPTSAEKKAAAKR